MNTKERETREFIGDSNISYSLDEIRVALTDIIPI
jgi:hypothetical protein